MFTKLTGYLVIPCVVTLSSLDTAQPATFEDDIFKIPQGAALVNSEVFYHNNTQMEQDDEGKFTLIKAKLASIRGQCFRHSYEVASSFGELICARQKISAMRRIAAACNIQGQFCIYCRVS